MSHKTCYKIIACLVFALCGTAFLSNNTYARIYHRGELVGTPEQREQILQECASSIASSEQGKRSARNNDALRNACYQLMDPEWNQPDITEFGAGWLTNNLAYSNGDYYNTKIEIKPEQITSDNKATISILYAVGRRVSDGSGYRYAREVKVLSAPVPGTYREPGQTYGLTVAPYIELGPGEFTLKGGTWLNGDSTFTSEGTFIHKNVTLDINSFKASVQPNTCGDGNPNCYKATVYVYRCYGIVENGTVDTLGGSRSIYGGYYQNSCSATKSDIQFVLPGESRPQEDPSNTPTPIVNAAQTQCDSAGDAGPYYGNTVSKVSVTNHDTGKSGVLDYNDSSGGAEVFAKPDDQVQFIHKLCFGVQGVQGGPGTSNTFSLSTTKILGTNRTSLFNRTTTLARGQARPPQLSADGTDPNVSQQVAYGFTLSSPHATDAQGRQVGRYEVTNEDVGTAITQSLQHNVKSGFVNQRFNIGGSCSCNNNSAGSTNSPIFGSYDAVRDDKTYAYWGAISNYSCSTGGKCNCSCSNGAEPTCLSWSCGTQYKYNTPSRSYPTTFNDGNDVTKTAKVYIPYNFTTNVGAYATTKTVSAGSEASFMLTRIVADKANPLVANKDSEFATYHTKLPEDRHVQIVSFTLPADTSHELEALKGNDNATLPGKDTTGARLCDYFKGYGLNYDYCHSKETSDFDRESSESSTKPIVSVASSTPIGTKVCMAVATYPSDSYNRGAINHDTTIDIAMKGGSTWNISNVACTTVAKTPSLQVWNGGVYTSGSISAQTIRVNDIYFGSWSEQIVIAGGSISDFASGAKLGYGDTPGQSYNFSSPTQNRGQTLRDFSPLTIANFNNANIGSSGINIQSSSYIQQLKGRYRPANIMPSGSISQWLDGNVNSGTQIIYSEGTITIDKNICYGGCNANVSSRVRLIDQNFTASSAADLPQVLIFAKNININPDVTRIDAWLIAEDAINTCSLPDRVGVNAENCKAPLIINGPAITSKLALNRTGGSDPGNGTSESPSSNPLVQDLSNDGPITPAEIFNLRPDVYFWGQNQANEANNLVTTYTRELAPRY